MSLAHARSIRAEAARDSPGVLPSVNLQLQPHEDVKARFAYQPHDGPADLRTRCAASGNIGVDTMTQSGQPASTGHCQTSSRNFTADDRQPVPQARQCPATSTCRWNGIRSREPRSTSRHSTSRSPICRSALTRGASRYRLLCRRIHGSVASSVRHRHRQCDGGRQGEGRRAGRPHLLRHAAGRSGAASASRRTTPTSTARTRATSIATSSARSATTRRCRACRSTTTTSP